MRRSVRWHLLLSSLAVSMMAILAVGLVTFLLVDNYFSQQEEDFLSDRGESLVEPLEIVLRGGNPADLQQIASFGLLANQMRVRILDARGSLLVDSGSFSDLISVEPRFRKSQIDSAFQFLMDDLGHLQGFGFPMISGGESFESFFRQPADSNIQNVLPSVTFAQQQPISDYSDVIVQMPLRVNNRVVAIAELSEGPAFGKAIRDSIQKALIAGGVVAIIVAGIAAIISARQLTRPLEALGGAANQMAEGNLSARAPSSNLKEYDRLATRFNTMADRLGATISSLEAERSSLKRFIADASHELRTPLTALKTFNQLLSQNVTPEREPESTFIAESGLQINQLDQLTSDLLNLSRLEARLSGTDFTTEDIRPAIERSIQAIRPQSAIRRQKLIIELSEEPIVLSHDPAAIERAVDNLLSNAVKFTPEEGTIQICTTLDEEGVTIIVRDSGLGISPSEQLLIFERFYRGRNQKVDGSGLGLAISQEIAAIHGGRIEVESEEEKGSSFALILPLSASEES
jgi:signal transduction histidine kinase